MSTKAEQKRYADERKHPSKRDAATPRKSRSGEPGEHENKHAAKKAAFALETRSEEGRASRKSTRGSANHQRTDTGKLRQKTMTESKPEAKAARAAATAKRSHGKPRPR